ncbi:neprilysin-1-like [Ornithodoros turicata]|uniref:neprilysin-1-like n=1 Tax=Ornithodoros turicata TaxID=34597 RepID=UPI00313915F0
MKSTSPSQPTTTGSNSTTGLENREHRSTTPFHVPNIEPAPPSATKKGNGTHQPKGAPANRLQRGSSPQKRPKVPKSEPRQASPAPIPFKKIVSPAAPTPDVNATPTPGAAPAQKNPGKSTDKVSQTATSPSKPPESDNKLEGRSMKICNGGHIVVALAAILLLSMLGYVLISKAFSSPQRQACNTAVCQQYSNLMQYTINTSVDPCDNFYRYTCDGWNSKQPLPVMCYLLNLYAIFLRNSVMAREKPIPTKGQSGDEKAIAFYSSCTNIFNRKANEMPAIRNFLDNANLTWPHLTADANLLEAMFYISRTLGFALFLDMEFSKNATHAVVVLSTPSYLLNTIEKRNRLIKSRQYENFLALLMKHFATPGMPSIAVEEQVALESEPLRSLGDTLSQGGDDSTPQVIDYSLKDVTGTAEWPGFTPERWERAFKEYLGIPSDIEVRIKVPVDRYMKALRSLLDTVGETKLQFLAGYLLAVQVSIFANNELQENLYRGTTRPRETAKEESSRFCLNVTLKYMGSGYLHTHERDWPSSKQLHVVDKIAERVQQMFITHYGVKANVSLTQFVHKFTDIHRSLDVNKTYRNYPDMGDKFTANLQAAIKAYEMSSAEYIRIPGMDLFATADIPIYRGDPPNNDTYFYPYVFLYPLYHDSSPLVHNYAGIGTELSLAFANLVMRNKIDNDNVSCAMKANPHVKDQALIKDMLIRAAAADMTWMSFKGAESEGKGIGLDVPGFTHDQLFFILFCYSTCSRTKKGEDMCNVSLRSSVKFNEVFACPPTSFMGGGHLCRSPTNGSSASVTK